MADCQNPDPHEPHQWLADSDAATLTPCAGRTAAPSTPDDRRERYATAIEQEVALGPTALYLAREAAMAVADEEITEALRISDAATNAMRDADRAENARLRTEVERLSTMLDEYRCPACGGEGGGGTMDPDAWINCQTCRGTGRTGGRPAVLREVIAGLEADRASHLAATRNPPYPEFAHTGSGIAGGLLTAVYRILARYEGHEAAHRHVAETLHAEKQAATDEAQQTGEVR